MTIKLGVIMDPLESINVKHDSTVALLREAQTRRWSVFYMEQKDLYVENGMAYANMQKIKLTNDEVNWVECQEKVSNKLHALDIILMRKDPPVDTQYIYTTQILDIAEKQGVLVVNKPQSLRDFNEKLVISLFPECCTPTLITTSSQQIKEFLREHKEIICKPLYGMGGTGVFRLHQNDFNLNVVIETLSHYGSRQMMVQRYIPEISKGDKRILMIDGDPFPYALARFAKKGETRANLAAGGSGKKIKLSKNDYKICEQLKPALKEKGILFAGIDVIGNYLTEINITSPTCIRELDTKKISSLILNTIESKL
jgi:glutathione synthase